MMKNSVMREEAEHHGECDGAEVVAAAEQEQQQRRQHDDEVVRQVRAVQHLGEQQVRHGHGPVAAGLAAEQCLLPADDDVVEVLAAVHRRVQHGELGVEQGISSSGSQSAAVRMALRMPGAMPSAARPTGAAGQPRATTSACTARSSGQYAGRWGNSSATAANPM
jgi:hypothetical protein